MEQEQLIKTLEALLFVAAKPFSAKELAKILELEVPTIQSALDALAEEKKDDGIILLSNNNEYQLATNSRYSTQVKNFLNAELREKLTDATVEVLAIIAYRQPISKAEIEAIRGVNSQYSLRNLLMRGLIEKVSNPSDARSFLYQTTTEFLIHLGLASVKDLPEFEKLVEQIKLPETPAITNANTDEAVKAVEPVNLTPPEPEKVIEPEKASPITETQTQPMVEELPKNTSSEDLPEEDDEDETEDEDDDDEEDE